MSTKQLYKLKNICLNCFKILMLRAFLHRAVSTIEWHDVPIFAGKTLALSGLYKWQNKCYKDGKILANHLSSISTFANWFVVKKIICLSVLLFLLTHLKNKKNPVTALFLRGIMTWTRPWRSWLQLLASRRTHSFNIHHPVFDISVVWGKHNKVTSSNYPWKPIITTSVILLQTKYEVWKPPSTTDPEMLKKFSSQSLPFGISSCFLIYY